MLQQVSITFPSGRVELLGLRDRVEKHLNSRSYQFTKNLQQNLVTSRIFIDFFGGYFPAFLTELIGRNSKSAVETALGFAFRIANILVAPYLLIPRLIKTSTKKLNLPEDFKKLFHVQFFDLTSSASLEQLKNKLIEYEGKENVDKYLGKNIETQNKKLQAIKSNLVKAKCFVRKYDLLSRGLIMYLYPWIRNWFSKNILGVVGHTGEVNFLNDSQREESANTFYEKYKYLQFVGGMVPLFLGNNVGSKLLYNAVTETKPKNGPGVAHDFIRKNINSYDYYKNIFSNRLSLFFLEIFSGVPSRLLANRSINEFVEKSIRMVVSLTSLFWSDIFAHLKLSQRHDKKFETEIVGENNEGDKKVKRVKTLNELEHELSLSLKENDLSRSTKLFKSILGQVKLYYQSIVIDALVMGVGLTSFNIFNTWRRIRKGVY